MISLEKAVENRFPIDVRLEHLAPHQRMAFDVKRGKFRVDVAKIGFQIDRRPVHLHPDQAMALGDADLRQAQRAPVDIGKAGRVNGLQRTVDMIGAGMIGRSEEKTSELQSLMRRSYAVFCLKKKK